MVNITRKIFLCKEKFNSTLKFTFLILLKILIKLKLFSTLNRFADYFQTIDDIKQNDHSVILKINCVKSILYFKSAHYFWLYFSQNKLTKFENIVQFNFIAMENLPAYFNLYVAFFTLISIKLINGLYFENNGICSAILRDLLIHNGMAYFPKSHYEYGKGHKICMNLFRHSLNDSPIWRNIQFYAILLQNILTIMFIIMCKRDCICNLIYFKVYNLFYRFLDNSKLFPHLTNDKI